MGSSIYTALSIFSQPLIIVLSGVIRSWDKALIRVP